MLVQPQPCAFYYMKTNIDRILKPLDKVNKLLGEHDELRLSDLRLPYISDEVHFGPEPWINNSDDHKK